MGEHPILFSGEMVRAILAGRKTETRRVIKPQPPNDTAYPMLWEDEFGPKPHLWINASDGGEYDTGGFMPWFGCPFGKPGDLLWVRETWQPYFHPSSIDKMGEQGILYVADGMKKECELARDCWHPSRVGKARPSIHMPKWACRLWLRGTGVRVERLHDITETVVRAEGVIVGGGYDWHKEYLGVFRRLWNKLNAKRGYGWDMNPWVWVIQFERVENERHE